MRFYTPRQLLAIAFLGTIAIGLYYLRCSYRQGRLHNDVTPANVWVEIRGDVVRPGLYGLPPEKATLDELVKKAGGLKGNGNTETAIKRVPSKRVAFGDSWKLKLLPGDEVRIARAKVKGTVALSLGLKMPVNSATEKDLLALPLMTARVAHEIVKYRDAHGPISSPSELKTIKGVTDRRLKRWKPYLSFER